MKLRVLAAPDKFRGTATATEVAAAVCGAAARRGWNAIPLPLADGGEGTLHALGGANRMTRVTGPLGQPVEALWRMDEEHLAVIEAAEACGLQRAGGAVGNDPMSATTRGVGELIVQAINAGARQVLVGVGGSATTDGGAGAMDALRSAGVDFAASGPSLMVCCDVETTFTQAAIVFGAQKGAGPLQVIELTARLCKLRADLLARVGLDVDTLPGSGAAGGLAGGLASCGARLVPGFDTIAEYVGLSDRLRDIDLVVTGEGRLDASSLTGKTVGGVIRAARARRVPVLVVAGTAAELSLGDGVEVIDLTSRYGSERSNRWPLACIEESVGDALDERIEKCTDHHDGQRHIRSSTEP